MTDGVASGENEMTGAKRLPHAPGPRSRPHVRHGWLPALPYDAARRLGLAHFDRDERPASCRRCLCQGHGRVGVCDATLGPGATNLVTAHRGSERRQSLRRLWRQPPRPLLEEHDPEARQTEILPRLRELIRVEQIERLPELVRCVSRWAPAPVARRSTPEDICHGTFLRAPGSRRRPALAGGTGAAGETRCRRPEKAAKLLARRASADLAGAAFISPRPRRGCKVSRKRPAFRSRTP